MSNVVQVGKKLNIQFVDGTATGYEYDFVLQNFEDSVVGSITKKKIDSEEYTYILKGYSNVNGKVLFCISDVIHYRHSHEGVLIIEKENNKFYVYFNDTKKVCGPFQKVECIYNQVVVSKMVKTDKGEKYVKGSYSYYGEVIVPLRYDDLSVYDEFIVAHKNGKAGVFSHSGECYLPMEYDEIKLIRRGSDIKYLIVRSAATGKYGAFYSNGKALIPTKYSSIKYIREYQLFVVGENGLYGLYNSASLMLFSPIFSYCKELSLVPLIQAEIEGNIFYYWPSMDRLFSKDCIEICKDKIKYLDGKKWKSVKRKNNN